MQQFSKRIFSLNPYFVFIALIGCQLAEFTSGRLYLKEKPSFLQPCHLHDPSHGECLANVFENLFSHWRDGVTGLKGLAKFDPFHVKLVRLLQRKSKGDINVELTNVEARGMSATKVLKMNINNRDYTIDFKLLTPKIDFEADYKARGHILSVNLDSVGNFTSTLENLEYHIRFRANLKQVDGLYFFQIVSVAPHIESLGNFEIHFSNLFGGNMELEDSAHDLFNNNWREVFTLLRHLFLQPISSVIFDRYKRILEYVPADYFLDDLP